MDLSSILLAVALMLGATAVCVVLFERLGFGVVLGFIVAGIFVGPHTPGPVVSHQVDSLQNIAELGVVLFLFTVGLQLRPSRIWSMRRLLFGLGSAQILGTAAALASYGILVADLQWESAVVMGLGFALSSTAIIMAILGERGELASEHGRTAFAVLMAQDLWVVPIMALIPVLAHQAVQGATSPAWERVALVAAVIAGVVVIGRYALPAVLGYCAARRRMEAFGIVVFLSVVIAAWAVDRVGISMTLGAFLMGMLLSASEYRYQIEAIVSPFRGTLMGLFFIAVGMSIDVGAFLEDWPTLLAHIPAIMALKIVVLIALAAAFGLGREAAVRVGFYLSQVGEFAFVLVSTASVAGLLSAHGQTLSMLAISATMILTPLMVKLGDRLASGIRAEQTSGDASSPADLEQHVVVIGYDEVGQLICLLLEKANIPYVACDRDIEQVRLGVRTGHNVLFGDLYSPVTQKATGLGKAMAAYISMRDMQAAKALAVTLHRFHPALNIYLRVATIRDQDEMVARGIRHATTGYIESTLAKGGQLLLDVGVSEVDMKQLIEAVRNDNYALVRSRVGTSGIEAVSRR